MVFPIPGGAIRIKSSRDWTTFASEFVVIGSSNPSARSVSATDVEGHFAVRLKTSRSAVAADWIRSNNFAYVSSTGSGASSYRNTRCHESFSAFLFQSRRRSTENSESVESIAFP